MYLKIVTVLAKNTYTLWFQYMGLWHEIEGYPSTFQQGTCNNAFYTLVGGVVDVYNTQVIGERLDEIDGSAVIASTDGSAKLTVTFPVDGDPNVTVSTSYWVLDTDYVSYALVYTCEDLGNDNRAGKGTFLCLNFYIHIVSAEIPQKG